MSDTTRLIIVSGLSGSGKTVALARARRPGLLLHRQPARATAQGRCRRSVFRPGRSRPWHCRRHRRPQSTLGSRVAAAPDRGISATEHPDGPAIPAGRGRRAAEALQRDAPAPSAGRTRGRTARRDQRGTGDAGGGHQFGGPDRRHLAHQRLRTCRHHSRARRQACIRLPVGAGRVVRFQTRHPGRRRLRVRHAVPAESVLGPRTCGA